MTLRYALSPAVTGTAAPCIPQAKAWGATYAAGQQAAGPLLDLSQGVPGEPPHATVLDALSKVAGSHGAAKYGAILGEPDMRAALATQLRHQYQLNDGHLQAQDVGITTGCNMAFLILLMCLCPPNESSILLPLPSYFNHAMSLSLQSITPAYLPCDPAHNFFPSLEAARAILTTPSTKKPRAIVLVTPNNPTGSTYTPDVLAEWLALARQHNIPLVLDETYRDFASTGAPHELFKDPQWRESLITLGSFSKGYRIPGHRLGSITAHPDFLQQVATVADCMQICPPRAPQLALAPLLPSLTEDMVRYAAALRKRLTDFGAAVACVPGWRVLSSGGFYAYVEFPEAYTSEKGRKALAAALGKEMTRVGSGDVGQALATRCGVLTLPGCFFMPELDDPIWASVRGGDAMHEDRWIRFAVANVSDDTIAGLADRLRALNTVMGM
ncbi:hypothetical protein CcaverHIS002_0107500 [Cutaneotrichosporon cavernicola]|uniref:Aminotransferase class I/classII large domain-containing protein n=1 Tax=Cutaneotrichosporon cavernicola TaxID=279322 RepID=A0AA48L0V3_9TREE|nr:uncharacterized protein CcaverHIS019_0107450 [Cutaneotrichosporon cavernicola]BEI80221.1 hypothetical protein CcaverHIS002_0107500 [Cutaneotrichosporon cavernicola]BEI88027.1 hypothetical protein CcaverHIS019_0107450 [Cutaneotrichosporon cavernicola]BEI95800.1 hypothetical protein CcaverHIS631_0107490 [Cutaneotrichosporon cavernicola]BEJ03573.1 hypothetical protein CcaverHIS641_0107480 [Cutaneotrichosporon cavernicola]